jgi:hypothetical protein
VVCVGWRLWVWLGVWVGVGCGAGRHAGRGVTADGLCSGAETGLGMGKVMALHRMSVGAA